MNYAGYSNPHREAIGNGMYYPVRQFPLNIWQGATPNSIAASYYKKQKRWNPLAGAIKPLPQSQFQPAPSWNYTYGQGRRKRPSAKKWIQGAIRNPGALHRALHVPAGVKIPKKKISKAVHSKIKKLRKMAILAETLARLRTRQ